MLALGRTYEKIKAQPFIAAVAVAGVASIGLLTASRGGAALGAATDSRYGTMAGLYWVGVVLLADWTGWKRRALALLMVVCVIRSVTMIPFMARSKETAEMGRAGLLAWSSDRFLLIGGLTTPSHFDTYAQLMRQWHYSLFRNQNAPAAR